MFDPLRTDTTRTSGALSDSDRSAKIEQLLLDGLDCYFTAQYEQAINVWTRALFLDRSHPRARAYIERARRALAERQRESEELLQSGLAAFGRGEGGEARRLLEEAVRRGAPADEALAVLGRLDRIDQRPAVQRQAAPDGGRAQQRVQLPVLQPQKGHARGSAFRLFAAASAIGTCAWLVVASGVVWQTPLEPPQDLLPQVRPSSAGLEPAIPLRAEVALTRARALVAGGRLHDAIAALRAIRPTDAQNVEAERLRGDIQRQLIYLTLAAESAAAGRLATNGRAP
jgi:hypothetical protein